MPKSAKFKLGHLYAVQYEDHWAATEATREEVIGSRKFPLRSRGVCIHDDPKMVILEHQTQQGDPGDNKRGDFHGIVKSTITDVIHFGKEEF